MSAETPTVYVVGLFDTVFMPSLILNNRPIFIVLVRLFMLASKVPPVEPGVLWRDNVKGLLFPFRELKLPFRVCLRKSSPITYFT